eukprot:c26425_g1_i2 orf=240-1916(+)
MPCQASVSIEAHDTAEMAATHLHFRIPGLNGSSLPSSKPRIETSWKGIYVRHDVRVGIQLVWTHPTFGLNCKQPCELPVAATGHGRDTPVLRKSVNSLHAAEDANDLISEPLEKVTFADEPSSHVDHMSNSHDSCINDSVNVHLVERDSSTAVLDNGDDSIDFNSKSTGLRDKVIADVNLTSECSAALPAASHRAKRVLDFIWESMRKLEEDLSEKEVELGMIPSMDLQHPSIFSRVAMDSGREGNAAWESQTKLQKLELELAHLHKELEQKDRSIALAASEMRRATNTFGEAEILLSSVTKLKVEMETAQSEQLLQYARCLFVNQQRLEDQSGIDKALDSADEKVSRTQTLICQLQNDLICRNHIFEIFQKEGKLFCEALQLVSQDLSRAEGKIAVLEDNLKREHEAMAEEKKTFASTNALVEKLHEGIRLEKVKVDDLTAEIAILKEEAIKNEEFLVSAASYTDALKFAEKQTEQLSSQLHAMENQLKSRDLLLEEVREETIKITEALKLATQIKQDLNLSRQRELELREEFDRQVMLVKELEQDLVENRRAAQAE